VVRRAASLHDDHPDSPVPEPAFELPARQALLRDNLPAIISNSDLEYALGKINCNGSRMHFGLLSSKSDPHEHRHRLFGDEKTEESIPSITVESLLASLGNRIRSQAILVTIS